MGWAISRYARRLAVAVMVMTGAGDMALAQGNLILSGLTFPPRIAGTQRGLHTNFEKEKQGYGHGVAYSAPDWTINIFIYDLGEEAITRDVASAELSGQLDAAAADIEMAQARGAYRNVSALDRFEVAGLDRVPRFRCARYAMRVPDKGDVDSYVCLTSWEGKYVKFRATTDQLGESEGVLRQYLGAWIDHMWPNG